MSIDQLVLLATAVGGLVTAIAALQTVREMKRQRESSYRPDFVVMPAHFSAVSLDRSPSLVVRGELPGDERPQLRIKVQNVGLGAAKEVRLQWKVNLADLHIEGSSNERSPVFVELGRETGHSVYHNITAQSHHCETVVEAGATRTIDVPDFLCHFVALRLLSFAAGVESGSGNHSLAFSTIGLRIEYQDLDGRPHVRQFSVSPNVMSVLCDTATTNSSDGFATGTFDVEPESSRSPATLKLGLFKKWRTKTQQSA